MKQFFTLSILLLMCSLLYAQLPGGNFEHWKSLIFEDPLHANWTCWDEELTPGREGLLEKSDDASHGSFAIKFETFADGNFGYLIYGQFDEGPSGGIPFADDPTQVTLSYKCNMAEGDSAQVWVWLFSGGEQLTEDIFKIAGVQADYTDVTFNLSSYDGTPDSLLFVLVPIDPFVEMTRTEGSVIYFDHVRFNGTNNLQLPDNSFEIWDSKTLVYTDQMTEMEALVEKSDDAYNGNFALKMTTRNATWDEEDNEIDKQAYLALWGIREHVRVGEDWEPRIVGGLPIPARKDTLVFYYKYIPETGVLDTAEVGLKFDKDSIEVIHYWGILLPVDTFTRFEIPYDLDNNWTGGSVDADSMMLELESSKWRIVWTPEDVDIEGSSLYIDYIYLKSQEEYLGIQEINNNSVSVFPNPATDMLHVKGIIGITTIQIFAPNGKLMMQEMVSGNASINIRDLPEGFYLVRVDDRLAGKFIKLK